MVDWGGLLVGQLTYYWEAHLWPRLEGLSDQEYLWEPVPGCWSLRPGPDGRLVMEREWPEPSPPPVTTIAWRVAHIGADCFGARTSMFFGDGSASDDAAKSDPDPPDAWPVPRDLPGTAAAGLRFLEGTYQGWRDSIAALSAAELTAPLGPKAGPYASEPMAGLILHISREVMHHGGEICLLRDLYRASGGHRLGQPGTSP